MKKSSLLSLFLTLGLLGCTQAGEPTSLSKKPQEGTPEFAITDYQEARKLAKAEGKPLLLDFTGSDWCPPCIRLRKDVLGTAEFAQFASANLVTVYLDFPRRKPQSDELKKQNQQLAQEYRVEGFPTLILLSPDGKTLYRHVGYLPGGPNALIRNIQDATKGS